MLIAVALGGAFGTDFLSKNGIDLPQLPLPQQTPDLSGAVTHVRDGDTIEVAGIAVRLATLDCDERGSTTGDRATDFLRGHLRGKSVVCELEGRKSYDREVGNCTVVGGMDIGRIMIDGGFCGRWR